MHERFTRVCHFPDRPRNGSAPGGEASMKEDNRKKLVESVTYVRIGAKSTLVPPGELVT